MQLFKKHRIWFALGIGIIAVVFRDILLHPSSLLIDSRDYPYIAWVMYQNISHILGGNFAHYFDTSAFYPHPYGLLFSDLLIPQSLMALPIYVLTKDMIASFNVVFFLTFVLNFSAWYVLWYAIAKNTKAAFIGSLLGTFGPFFHIQIAHFQMQSYWPGLFALGLLFYVPPPKLFKKTPSSIVAGILMGMQFLASVYMFVFIICAIGLKYALDIVREKNRLDVVKEAGLFLVTTAVIVLPFVKGYYDMKAYYGLERNIEEYIFYSAHISDYLFTRGYSTLAYQNPLFAKWNGFNMHLQGESAIFPGFTLLILALLGLVTVHRHSSGTLLGIRLSSESLYYTLLGGMGFLFSLGPRLNFNGTYAHIPNVYLLGQKVMPLLESIRSPNRWSFLLYFALLYFAVLASQKKNIVGKPVLFATIVIVLMFEYVPLHFHGESVHINKASYSILAERCLTDSGKSATVTLEYPVTHLTAYGGIVEGLSYISNVLITQTYHNCYLVNGYSGFIPQETFAIEGSMNALVEKGSATDLEVLMRENDIDVVKFNEQYVLPEYRIGYAQMKQQLLSSDSNFTQLQDTTFELQAE